MELTKENYIKQRGNINILFQMFCEIRKLKPTKEENTDNSSIYFY